MYPDDEDEDDIARFTGLDLPIQLNAKCSKILKEKSSAGPVSRPASAKSTSTLDVGENKKKDSKFSLIKLYTMLIGLFMVLK